MEIEFHSFPTMNDGRKRVEELYCILINKYRNGDSLDEETLDWLDSANTWLMSV